MQTHGQIATQMTCTHTRADQCLYLGHSLSVPCQTSANIAMSGMSVRVQAADLLIDETTKADMCRGLAATVTSSAGAVPTRPPASPDPSPLPPAAGCHACNISEVQPPPKTCAADVQKAGGHHVSAHCPMSFSEQ